MPRNTGEKHHTPSTTTNKAKKTDKKLNRTSTLTAKSANAPNNDELATLQATELEVLASILGADFSKVDASDQSPWHGKGAPSSDIHSPAAFQVLLRPDTDSLKSSVFATARFRLPIRYPVLPPIITVLTGNKHSRGLSGDHLKALQDVLTDKAKELAGEGEILWDVISAAQEYISLNNLEKVSGPNRSLEEEKKIREKERVSAMKQKAHEESQKKTKEEEERASKIAQLIREQSERNTVAMQQQKERKRDATQFSPSDVQLMDYLDEHRDTSKPSSAQRTEFFLDPIEMDSQVTHRVIVGPIVSQNPISTTYLVQSAHKDVQQTWRMDEYVIETPFYSLSSGKRALEEVEWELDRLRTLHCESLVNVRACALVAKPVEKSSSIEGSMSYSKRLLIVHDYVQGPTLSTLLSHGIQLPWSRVRHYLRDIVKALDCLHAKNLVHRDVTTANIILEESASETALARLGRSAYDTRLRDMNATHPLAERQREQIGSQTMSSSLPSDWDAPELKEEHDAKSQYTRKRDVWQTGVVTLQTLFGSEITSRYASPAAFFEEPFPGLSSLDAHVVALLKSILEPSTRKRLTANEVRRRLDEIILYEDEERSNPSTSAPTTSTSDPLQKIALPQRRGFVRSTSEREEPFRPGSFWQLNRAGFSGNSSRYENDFEELGLLGKGAYGAVFRARNRLDGIDYAIKKIRLSASAENDEKTLREITALSRLSHQNIVRYVTCWIQVQDGPLDYSTTEGTLTSSMHTTDSLNLAVPGINDDFMSVGHDAFSGGASHIRFANSDSEDDDEEDGAIARYKKVHKAADVDQDDKSTNCSSSSSSSDSESESEQDDEDVHQGRMHQSFSTSNVVNGPSQPRWLFIQMEFVEDQTLREAINRGISVDDCWRLFQQMVQALAHVASLGIIHRDLKPSNILMYRHHDATSTEAIGDIKIGDFGLATTTPQNQPGENLESSQVFSFAAQTNGESVEQTVEIGTDLYIAPEVLKSGTSRYDSKVDVYAAGIVFFEMLASQRIYKTGMERVHVLRNLRLPEVRFPEAWNEAQFEAQTKIIRRMLSHDPSERPSALELLKSDLLPPKMEDEYIAECMRLISMPNSTYNLQLMESLFDPSETYEARAARDFTFDTGSNEGQGLDNRFIGVASQYLRRLFRRRGAVELEAPLLIPPNELYATEQNKPVELLDRTGKVVQLPFDLIVPFARLVARGEQQRFKRYAIAPVYRPNLLAGGQPRSVIEVDFDIVAPEKTPAAEAEVLGVIDEILDEVPGLNASEWVIQISHGAVLDLLLERVPSSRRDQAIVAIGKLTSNVKSLASQGRVQLAALGLTRSVSDEIESANLSDDIDIVSEKLHRLIAIDLQPRLKRAVDSIRKVISAAQQFGVQRRFMFTPLLASNMSFYRDNVYFVVSRGRGKRRDVLASGGRFDALLKRFASPTLARPPAHAVGVQIALGRIAVALAKHHEELVNGTGLMTDERLFNPFVPRRCDVYIASAPGLLATRMEICRELWAANISADLAYESALEESPELQASTCRAEGILFLVIARSRGSMVKVKAIFTRTEYEVHRWELCTWLADRIHRLRTSADAAFNHITHAGIMGTTGSIATPTAAQPNTASNASAAMQFASDVEVILPERQQEKRKADKHGLNDTRRGRRQAHLAPMQEKAARQVAKLMEEMTGSASMAGSTKLPILAVDINVHATHGGGSSGGSSNFASSNGSSNTASMSTTPSSNATALSLGPQTGSSFSLLCSAAFARTDDVLWRLFIDSLPADEREYGKQLRKRISENKDIKRSWLVSVRSEGGVALI